MLITNVTVAYLEPGTFIYIFDPSKSLFALCFTHKRVQQHSFFYCTLLSFCKQIFTVTMPKRIKERKLKHIFRSKNSLLDQRIIFTDMYRNTESIGNVFKSVWLIESLDHPTITYCQPKNNK